MIADPYKVLGIREDVSDQELKKAYRDLSKKYHPDANPDNPEAAEEKFKEIQEAYRQIQDARERGISAYGRMPSSGPNAAGRGSYGGNGYRTGSYGQSQYQTHSAGQNQAGGYRRYEYKEYSDASSAFEDFFTQWADANQGGRQANQAAGEAQYDSRIQAAVNHINRGYYQEALNALNGIAPALRDAQWFYVSAIANQGAGNNFTAMNHAKRAVDLDPANRLYAQLLQNLTGGGVRYQERGASYTPATSGYGWCFSICALNLLCNACGGSGVICF